MGMTSEEFWNEPPRLAEAYREAHKLKTELINQDAWIYGMYVYDAVSVAIANAFGKQGAKKEKYLEKPLEIRATPQTSEEAKQKVINQLDAWKEAFEARKGINNGNTEH